jgi:hypothetical protein
MIVDAYYMEMEMLLQHARVRESVEMMMQCFSAWAEVQHQGNCTATPQQHHERAVTSCSRGRVAAT